MNSADLVQIALYLVLITALAVPLGRYMAQVYSGGRTLLDPVLRPVERLVCRLSGIDAGREMDWREYTVSLLAFNILGTALLFFCCRPPRGICP
ncbi:MAG: potassium-transporting ATPase subunit KdpA [Peptococcaceae bacterium]|nr:potassium-transporting ATPase subunit KdpA [Peptococcaceae bacterium]